MEPVGPQRLSQLLEEHGGALVLYARQWTDAPEDVVQEALLSLVRQNPLPENVVGWLYRAVRNEALSAARAAGRRHRREKAASRRECWFCPADEDRLDARAVTEALVELPVEQRETIVARLWGGLSLEEIAELTGSSTSTVHRRYHSGLAALRERFGVPCP